MDYKQTFRLHRGQLCSGCPDTHFPPMALRLRHYSLLTGQSTDTLGLAVDSDQLWYYTEKYQNLLRRGYIVVIHSSHFHDNMATGKILPELAINAGGCIDFSHLSR